MTQAERNTIEAAYKAICVMLLDRSNRAYLQAHDPMAFRQLESAADMVERNIEGITIPRARLADFRLEDHGSLALLTPLTDTAREWVEEKIQDGFHWHGNAIVVEHRYIRDIARGIKEDNLVLHMG